MLFPRQYSHCLQKQARALWGELFLGRCEGDAVRPLRCTWWPLLTPYPLTGSQEVLLARMWGSCRFRQGLCRLVSSDTSPFLIQAGAPQQHPHPAQLRQICFLSAREARSPALGDRDWVSGADSAPALQAAAASRLRSSEEGLALLCPANPHDLLNLSYILKILARTPGVTASSCASVHGTLPFSAHPHTGSPGLLPAFRPPLRFPRGHWPSFLGPSCPLPPGMWLHVPAGGDMLGSQMSVSLNPRLPPPAPAPGQVSTPTPQLPHSQMGRFTCQACAPAAQALVCLSPSILFPQSSVLSSLPCCSLFIFTTCMHIPRIYLLFTFAHF